MFYVKMDYICEYWECIKNSARTRLDNVRWSQKRNLSALSFDSLSSVAVENVSNIVVV